MEGVPEVEHLVGGEAEEFDGDCDDEGDEEEGENVIDQVLVPEFDVLERNLWHLSLSL